MGRGYRLARRDLLRNPAISRKGPELREGTMKLQGQAALVTGAGSGIGADVARHLVKAGAKVAVLDVNMEGAQAVALQQDGAVVIAGYTRFRPTDVSFLVARYLGR